MKALEFSVNVPRFLALKALGRLRKELYYRGPLATVRLRDVPEPELPGPDWVKIKTLVCGVCASDMNLIFLRESPSASPFTAFPCVMGHEICGEIEEVGPAVDGLAPGEVVTVSPALTCVPRGINPICPACQAGLLHACENYARGGLSPGMFIGICPDTGGGFGPFLVAHQSQIFKLHPWMTPEEGALIEPLAVALHAVTTNLPEKGEEVLVIGGGVIGGLIVRSIRALSPGVVVTVADPSNFAAEISKKAGADHVVTGGEIFEAAIKHTGAVRYKPMIGQDILMGGFNRVYDAVGHAGTLNTAMRCLAAGGTLSVVGLGPDVKLDLTPLWLKAQTMKGVYSFGMIEENGRKRHLFELALELAGSKKVNLANLVTHQFTLEEYEKMIEVNLNKEKHRAIKTTIVFE